MLVALDGGGENFSASLGSDFWSSANDCQRWVTLVWVSVFNGINTYSNLNGRLLSALHMSGSTYSFERRTAN